MSQPMKIVPVIATVPDDIGTIKINTVTGYFNQVRGNDRVEEPRCKKPIGIFEDPRYAIVFPETTIEYNQKNKSLIADISVKHYLPFGRYSGDSSYNQDIDYPLLTSGDVNHKYSYPWDSLKYQAKYTMKSECYTNHSGNGVIISTLNFLGAKTEKEYNFNWNGG